MHPYRKEQLTDTITRQENRIHDLEEKLQKSKQKARPTGIKKFIPSKWEEIKTGAVLILIASLPVGIVAYRGFTAEEDEFCKQSFANNDIPCIPQTIEHNRLAHKCSCATRLGKTFSFDY